MKKSPLDALTAFDADLVENYVYRATGVYPELGVSELLKSWNKSKESLFNGPFGGKLRMRTHVTADLSDDYDYMKKAVTNACLAIVPSLAEHLYNMEYNGMCGEEDVKHVLGLFNVQRVLDDRVVADDIEVAVNGKTRVFRGKRMRVIRRCLEFVGFEDMSLFTQFRDRVSLIRTTQRLDVDVVLSIHPVDFLSMSDNKSGWTSCMSLLGKGSCRSGVMEFMNSHTAVVAYTESDMPFLPGVPNKSWRMLLFYDVLRGVVLGGRQYPFFSEALAKGAICKLSGADPSRVCHYPNTSAERVLLEEMESFDVRDATPVYRDLVDKWLDKDKLHMVMDSRPVPFVAPFTYGACNDFFMFHEDETFFVTYLDNTNYLAQCWVTKLPMSGKPTCLLCGKELKRSAWGTSKVICDECAEEVSKRDETGDSI